MLSASFALTAGVDVLGTLQELHVNEIIESKQKENCQKYVNANQHSSVRTACWCVCVCVCECTVSNSGIQYDTLF